MELDGVELFCPARKNNKGFIKGVRFSAPGKTL
jgi:hypothetical protein